MTGGSLGIGLLWFIAVLAMIPVVLWLLKRTPYGAAMSGQAAQVGRVVGTLSIGPQQRLVTVEVGRGEEARWLVLGVTAQSITTLHALTPEPEATPPGEAASPFATLFRKARDARG